ncbi:hypothetical protein ACSX1C_00770 [Pseudomonas sp. MBLB4123]|uniref:hypothetical protein n=1 Tax=Pseudomonas sp. MBLB4123 TaxID=3451557 RepID=UPI003F751B48
MNYCDHMYHLWFFLPRAEEQPIWNYKKWHSITAPFNQIIASCRGNPSVRSQQLESNRKNQVKFGRIGWNEKSHQKWCHHDTEDKIFVDTQVWAPSPGQCEKESTPPDFFMAINNRANSSDSEHTFGSVIIMALRAEAFHKDESLAATVCNVTNPILWGYCQRPWGKRLNDSGAYTNSIQDMAVIGLLKTGNWQGKALDSECLRDIWEEVHCGGI